MHLSYSLQSASNANVKDHPRIAMMRLGIAYHHATPQSLGDCWWFWNCESVPSPLPPYLTELKIDDPHTCIGYGLSEEQAEAIAAYRGPDVDRKRHQLTDAEIERVLADVKQHYERTLEDKGRGIFVSTHEIRGALDEEVGEAHVAFHDDNPAQIRRELFDVITAAIHGIASLDSERMDW